MSSKAQSIYFRFTYLYLSFRFRFFFSSIYFGSSVSDCFHLNSLYGLFVSQHKIYNVLHESHEFADNHLEPLCRWGEHIIIITNCFVYLYILLSNSVNAQTQGH